jgi:hypothetical protein
VAAFIDQTCFLKNGDERIQFSVHVTHSDDSIFLWTLDGGSKQEKCDGETKRLAEHGSQIESGEPKKPEVFGSPARAGIRGQAPLTPNFLDSARFVGQSVA